MVGVRKNVVCHLLGTFKAEGPALQPSLGGAWQGSSPVAVMPVFLGVGRLENANKGENQNDLGTVNTVSTAHVLN